jgi:hypothetical protein
MAHALVGFAKEKEEACAWLEECSNFRLSLVQKDLSQSI